MTTTNRNHLRLVDEQSMEVPPAGNFTLGYVNGELTQMDSDGAVTRIVDESMLEQDVVETEKERVEFLGLYKPTDHSGPALAAGFTYRMGDVNRMAPSPLSMQSTSSSDDPIDLGDNGGSNRCSFFGSDGFHVVVYSPDYNRIEMWKSNSENAFYYRSMSLDDVLPLDAMENSPSTLSLSNDGMHLYAAALNILHQWNLPDPYVLSGAAEGDPCELPVTFSPQGQCDLTLTREGNQLIICGEIEGQERSFSLISMDLLDPYNIASSAFEETYFYFPPFADRFIDTVRFSEDGTRALCCSRDGGKLYGAAMEDPWNLDTLTVSPHGVPVPYGNLAVNRCANVSPDGMFWVSGVGDKFLVIPMDQPFQPPALEAFTTAVFDKRDLTDQRIFAFARDYKTDYAYVCIGNDDAPAQVYVDQYDCNGFENSWTHVHNPGAPRFTVPMADGEIPVSMRIVGDGEGIVLLTNKNVRLIKFNYPHNMSGFTLTQTIAHGPDASYNYTPIVLAATVGGQCEELLLLAANSLLYKMDFDRDSFTAYGNLQSAPCSYLGAQLPPEAAFSFARWTPGEGPNANCRNIFALDRTNVLYQIHPAVGQLRRFGGTLDGGLDIFTSDDARNDPDVRMFLDAGNFVEQAHGTPGTGTAEKFTLTGWAGSSPNARFTRFREFSLSSNTVFPDYTCPAVFPPDGRKGPVSVEVVRYGRSPIAFPVSAVFETIPTAMGKPLRGKEIRSIHGCSADYEKTEAGEIVVKNLQGSIYGADPDEDLFLKMGPLSARLVYAADLRPGEPFPIPGLFDGLDPSTDGRGADYSVCFSVLSTGERSDYLNFENTGGGISRNGYYFINGPDGFQNSNMYQGSAVTITDANYRGRACYVQNVHGEMRLIPTSRNGRIELVGDSQASTVLLVEGTEDTFSTETIGNWVLSSDSIPDNLWRFPMAGGEPDTSKFSIFCTVLRHGGASQ